VPKLWATRRIAQLQLDAAGASPEDAQNIVNDVIEDIEALPRDEPVHVRSWCWSRGRLFEIRN